MKQPINKKINIRGIERNTNDISSNDGASEEIINLRFKDGAWRPVGGKTEYADITMITGYDSFTNLYRHSALPEGLFIAKYNDDIILIDSSEAISPETYDGDASQSTTQFTIDIFIKGSYTITKDADWISLSAESGSGYDQITVTLDASSTTDRSGTITVTGTEETFTCEVSQEGINLTVSPSSYSIDASSQDVDIENIIVLPSDSEFTAIENPDVVMVTGIVNDQDLGVATVSISENTGVIRTATIRISQADFPTVYQDITITQAAPIPITCSPDELEWTGDVYRLVKTSTATLSPDATLSYEIAGTNPDKFTVTILDQETNEVSIRNEEENSSGNDYTATVEIKASGYASDYIYCRQISS